MFNRHHQGRRPTNIVFVIFRMGLSIVMLIVLLIGIYSAYKKFSGYDPLKLDPQAVVTNILAAKTPQQLIGILSSIKLSTKGLPIPKINPGEKAVLGNSNQASTQPAGSEVPTQVPISNLAFRFLLIADSHSDNMDLNKAIDQAKQAYPDLKFIIGLGDYTTVGTLAELKQAKKEFDNSSLRYFLIAGDHDLWDSRDKKQLPDTNFSQVFGPLYQSFDYNNFKFLLLDNSDDYKGMGETQKQWLEGELERIKQQPVSGIFVFIHEPLYHPSSDHVMGKIEKDLKQQARELMYQLKSAGVKKVFAGDTHLFSEYNEPVTGLQMVTVGAATIERNPQAPRFAVVSVFDNGSTKVDDVEIK